MITRKSNKKKTPVRIPWSEEEKQLAHDHQLDLDSSDNLNWRIFRIMAEFVSGFHFISQYEKTISFFGSARTDYKNRYYKEAVELAYKLGKSGFRIVTGGGPGIMEAGNKGAHQAGVPSVGLNIQLPMEQRANKYLSKGIGFHYFFTRKVMLSAIGQAYVFFPGGYGTLDEFFDMMNLIQTKKMEPLPIVLYGSDFWNPLAHWLHTDVYEKYKNMEKGDCELYKVVDSVEDAYKILKKSKPRTGF